MSSLLVRLSFNNLCRERVLKRFIVRYLPEWFPGTGFLQDAKKYNQIMMESILRPHQYVVQQMVGLLCLC